jgi:hypothetical protein
VLVTKETVEQHLAENNEVERIRVHDVFVLPMVEPKTRQKPVLSPELQADDDHTCAVSRSHPVPLVSSFNSSSSVHNRAPAVSQKRLAAAQVMGPLHPPRLRLLSPQIVGSPKSKALVQLSSSHVDAREIVGFEQRRDNINVDPPTLLVMFSLQ